MTTESQKRVVEKLSKIRKRCIAEKREPSDAEQEEATRLMDAIDLSEQIQDMAPEPERYRTPVDTRYPDGIGPGNRSNGAGYGTRNATGKKDFRSLFGHNNDFTWTASDMSFFQAVFSGRSHPMLNRAMTEGTPSAGGFAVPTEYNKQIHDVSLENELVMPMASVVPMNTSTLKIPAMEIGSHASSLWGGFQASYTAETASMSENTPKLREMTLNLNKLTGFLSLSNELAIDMGGEKRILDICGKGLSWYRDKAFLKGSGAGEPLGILNAGCTIEVAKEAGQSSSTVTYENLTKMLGSLWAGSFQNSVWVCHQSTIPQLLQLSISVGTGGSFIPVLSEKSGKFTILTRPVIFTEKTETLGSRGDIALCDFSQYIIGLQQGMRFELSQHLYFQTDKLAARLIERHDAQPLWSEALTLEDGSTEVSPFVVLAERA